jgi:hypothetical protein
MDEYGIWLSAGFMTIILFFLLGIGYRLIEKIIDSDESDR